MKLRLTRISTDVDVGTFGVLQWQEDPAPFAVSLEDPWLDNRKNISCIPAGDYICEPYDSPTHGRTFIVKDVPNRTFILFHKGNTHVNTRGCILIGESFTFIGGIAGIGHSGAGFKEFWERAMLKNELQLEIRWANPRI